jgi:hypothetical protein
MKQSAIFRFRDLVTEDGGTIQEHRDLIQKYGEVWWGWWMRQYETAPRSFFSDLMRQVSSGQHLEVLLFNSGKAQLFRARVARIVVAPAGDELPTPDPERSPAYYHRGRYPAWLLLKTMDEVDFDDLALFFDGVPTRPELLESPLSSLLHQRIKSLEQLRQFDVTLWAVSVGQ